MRLASHPAPIIDALVASTSYGDRVEATAWRGGRQVSGALPVVDYQLDWHTDRYVQGQASFVFADPDGLLWPRRIDSALAPGGSRLKLAYVFGANRARLPLGTWRIRETKPNTKFRYARLGAATVWLPGASGTVTVQADEETCSLDLDRLDPNERQPAQATVLSEVAFLARDYLTLNVHPAVADQDLPGGVEYGENRLTVIADLLDRIDAAYRIGGDGRLEIVPAEGTMADWTVEPGEGGTLVQVSNTMSDVDLVNQVVSHVTLEDERVLIGRARLATGPLAAGGPFGVVTAFRGANLATTQQQVDADAATTLTRIAATGDVQLQLETLAHPGLQLHDQVALAKPRDRGMQHLAGRVTSMTLTATGGLPAKAMRLALAVPHPELERNMPWSTPA